MELKDVDLDDLDIDEIDYDEEFILDSDSGDGSGNSKAKNNILKALLIVSINILVLLIVIIGLVIFAFSKGTLVYVPNVTANGNTEKPVYTETQMQELIEQARLEAEANVNTQVEQAQLNGYSIGQNDLLDLIKNILLSSSSSLRTFNSIFSDYFVIVSNGSYHFVPINSNLALSDYDDEFLTETESGEYQYFDVDGNIVSHKGIDVSEYQGDIDWEKVAADGVEFAFMRAYYRGYGTGRLVKDEKVEDNLQGAIDNGIHVGVYVFSQAINVEEAIEEANAAIETVAPFATNIPIVIDIERVAGANPRMDALSVDERTDVVLAFCNTISNAGYMPIIYFNTEMGGLYVDLERLENITKWYAWYGTWKYFPYEYDIWQYKDTGRVDGISGNVDMNIAFDAFWE